MNIIVYEYDYYIKMSSPDSCISTADISSFNDVFLFSTSPHVFNEIEYAIKTFENQAEIDLIMLKYNLVVKDILITGLIKKVKKYKLGYNVYQSLINSDPYYTSDD